MPLYQPHFFFSPSSLFSLNPYCHPLNGRPPIHRPEQVSQSGSSRSTRNMVLLYSYVCCATRAGKAGYHPPLPFHPSIHNARGVPTCLQVLPFSSSPRCKVRTHTHTHSESEREALGQSRADTHPSFLPPHLSPFPLPPLPVSRLINTKLAD